MLEINECESELPTQVLEHSGSIFLPEMHQDFGITGGSKPVPQPLKMPPLFGKIEQFPIVDHGNTAVLVVDRLLTIGEAHDAESPRDQPQTGTDQLAALVGSTMQNRPGQYLWGYARYKQPKGEAA